jgi:hypothetical protein
MQPKNFRVNLFLYFVLNFFGRPSWKELMQVPCGPLCSQNYYHSIYKVLMVYPMVHFRLIPMFVTYWVLIQSSTSFSNQLLITYQLVVEFFIIDKIDNYMVLKFQNLITYLDDLIII